MPKGVGGYQPDTRSPSSRRADFDLQRRIAILEEGGGGGGSGGVPPTRTISTTAPLTGGGDLSADRTLAITNFAGATPGAVPTSPGGSTAYLRADGTWATPPGTATSGSTILDGDGPPADSLGVVGNYYEDKLNGVLYGPKGSGGGVANAVLSEPFNNFTTAPWATSGTTSIVAARNGTGAKMGNFSGNATYTIPAPSESDTIIVGCAINVAGVGSEAIFMQLCSDAGATVHTELRWNSAGSLIVVRGSSGIGSSVAGVVAVGTWVYVEVKIKMHDTAGTLEVHANGATVIGPTSGIDTKNGGTKTTFDSVKLNCTWYDVTYDDLYIRTGAGATFNGDTVISASPWPVSVRRLPNDAVTNAMLANMPANTLKGNNTGSTADPLDLTTTQVKTLLALTTADVSGAVPTTRTISTTAPLTGGGDLSANRTLAISNFTSGAAGAVPASGGGTANYLRADGTWATPPVAGTPNWPDGFPTYDPRYVDVAGDTMIGRLIVNPANGPVFESGDDTSTANAGLRIRTGSSGTPMIDFYRAGVRVGYVQAHTTNSAMRLFSDSGDVIFYANGSENARFKATDLLIGTTDPVATNNTIGVIVSSTSPWVHIANAALNTPDVVCNKVGAGVGSGSDFIHFRTNSNTIGSITRNAQTAAVLYNTTSDYRLKQDLGRITGARERIRLLKPRRVTWNEDPTQQEQDGFMAHEVAEAVPEAVTGEKNGEQMQQLDSTRLIPLLTAALQDAWTQIDKLTARVSALEMA